MIIINQREHREREAESCVEKPMYRSSELIHEALIQTHGVQLFLCMHVECYAHAFYSFCYAFALMLCMYDFMFNV
jgi:hypothetical protein